MIKITFFKHDDVLYGFRETGHAEYDDAGKDIVCAAVSSMTMLLINTLEVSFGIDVDYKIDDATTDITVTVKTALPCVGAEEKRQYAACGVIQGYYLQLMDMIEDYYDYLDVSVEEVPV
ncbi:MAG: ribosomal-processing cysteine protease Prp [Clostridia bacterium]|nr:ribosomal-processing cysteine protease Prp [Clostridia bacterium]